MDALVNGVAASSIAISDRGLHYGDGLFETMLLKNGTVPLWPRHYRRLLADASRLGLTVPAEPALRDEITELAAGRESGVIKLMLTAGSGPRGYRRGDAQPSRILLFSKPHDYPAAFWQEGIRVRFCDMRLSRNRRLAGIKHLNRLENVLARNEWDDPAITEGLVLDEHDRVIEATSCNLFLLNGSDLRTPQLTFSGVNGIMREIVLETSRRLGLSVAETELSNRDVLEADGVFLTNSVVGIWPVRQIETVTWAISPVIYKLQRQINNEYGV
jgi:4-amino-4-deoxychorismate lyase